MQNQEEPSMCQEEKLQALYRQIAGLENAQDCQAFFEDLCTRKEL